MKVKPLGDRVLVELIDLLQHGEILIPLTANREQTDPVQIGTVRGVGTKCKLDISEGDIVGVYRNHGMELPHTDARLFFSQHVVIKKDHV